MKFLAFFLLHILLIPFAFAQADQLSNLELSDLRWQNRVLIIFAGDSEGEMYKNQYRLIEDQSEGITDRDLKVISIFGSGISNIDGHRISPSSVDLIRSRFENGSQVFRFIMIGKDGGVKLDSSEIVSMKVLFGSIDRMPMRREEMKRN